MSEPRRGPLPKVERMVVRAPNWLGDAILSLPALRDLRRAFPSARIEMLARPAVAGLYGAVSELDAVRVSTGLFSDAKQLRGEFDAGVLFTNSFGTALALCLAGIPERWGYARDARAPLLTRAAGVPAQTAGRSQVFYYRTMLEQIGAPVSGEPDASLSCPPGWRESARGLLPGGGPWVGVAPGAASGGAKRYPSERFAEAALELATERGARVVVVGTPAEREAARHITKVAGAHSVDLCGRTSLGELVGVLSELSLLLTNDSGPMHVATALGTPVLAVFGPTDWRETAPFGGRTALVREQVSCSPCRFRECPIDHRCMELVAPATVASAARQLLESGVSSPRGAS